MCGGGGGEYYATVCVYDYECLGDMGFIVSVYVFINCNESFKLALWDSNFMLDTLM